MSTSGTVSQTVISVATLIDHGAKRAGKLSEELTVEQVQAAKVSLYYLLSSLANQGVNYWAINKVVIGLQPNKYEYYLPEGTVDVLNANYRTLTNVSTGAYSTSGVTLNAFDGQGTNICQLSTNTGAIGIANGTGNPVYISTIGILPAVTGLVTANLQYSMDGVTWVTVKATGATNWVAGTWIYYDLDPSATAPYWRIQQVSGINMGFYQVVFGTMPIAIPMARMNRDDYSSLPNRSFTALRPLQYWLNRTISQPNMEVWPVPNNISPQIELWLNRYIQDVGDLSGEIEIPQYMYMSIQNGLAWQMALELPAVDPQRLLYLQGLYEKELMMAQNENRDKSPMTIQPNISGYTR